MGSERRMSEARRDSRPRVRRPAPTPELRIVELQRTAGNAAVSALLAAARTAARTGARTAARTGARTVQRTTLPLASGRSVGNDPSAANRRADVWALLDQLHVLWAVTNDQYDQQRSDILAAADPVPPATLGVLGAGLDKGLEGALAPAVAANTLGMTITNAVGPGLANDPADVASVGNGLAAEGLAPAGGDAAAVITGIAQMKRQILTGQRPMQGGGHAGGTPSPPSPQKPRPLSTGLVTLSPDERARVDAAGASGFATLPKDLRGKVEVEKTLARAGVTPADWYGSFVECTFLGNTTADGRGMHPDLVTRLKAAEAGLLALGPAESFGVHTTDKLRGFRSPPGGLHSYGLAVDINYETNPLIGSRTWAAAANAGLLLRHVPVDSNPISHQGAVVQAAGPAFDLLQQASTDLSQYFALRGNPAELEAKVQSLDGAGLNNPARTTDQWRTQINQDFDGVGPDFQQSGGPMRDRTRGFLDFDRRVVQALAAAGFTWLGGASSVQDTQHFSDSHGTAVRQIWRGFAGDGSDTFMTPF